MFSPVLADPPTIDVKSLPLLAYCPFYENFLLHRQISLISSYHHSDLAQIYCFVYHYPTLTCSLQPLLNINIKLRIRISHIINYDHPSSFLIEYLGNRMIYLLSCSVSEGGSDLFAIELYAFG